MEKRKLFTVVLFCLCFAGIALADEVINIDLNGQGDDDAYTGEAAIAGENVWQAIYQGTGVAVGSGRATKLVDYDDPCKPGIYAAQVWLTIPDDGLFTKVSGDDLMDDGFDATAITTDDDPCMLIVGEPQDGTLPSGAYGGTFDIYIYSSEPTSITVSNNLGSSTKSVTGTYVSGPLTTPANYVVFEDVVVDDGNTAIVDGNAVYTAGDANTVTIVWDNIINGIQIVKSQSPIEIDSFSTSGFPMEINPQLYDQAKESNAREGEPQPFGPDFGTDEDDPCEPFDYVGPIVTYLDSSDSMIYDINCSESDAGYYGLRAIVVQDGNNDAGLIAHYYNDATGQEIELGDMAYSNANGSNGEAVETSAVEFNIFAGKGYLRWSLGNDIYFNLAGLELYNIQVPPQMDDCDDVYFYKYNYLSDYVKNCRVDEDDLLKIVENWVSCYDPNTANCP